ncbi:MAG: reverse transcriptase domain-containing protein [Patescibacteria group bacterium]|nr:reverse transcriptase domain-containing protein [Patescibacteria group bacterium]MCL5431871.1 reverse transcriptase domain-containing protein [Patescibacteria group bacterium]
MNYSELTSLSNLFQAWKGFRKGKKLRVNLQVFESHLEDNLFVLQESLQNKTYQHGGYEEFYVYDPKVRHIHKADVADRIVHHLLYKYLYDLFDPTFIFDSYSCRLNKGTHKGVDRLEIFTRKVSKNYTQPCWVLKCDVKKFFANIDHKVLKEILKRKIGNPDILGLLDQVIESFHSELGEDKGIPLGNLTSQIFANIYLNRLDQFVKAELKIKYYLRYADDFVFLAGNKSDLERLIDPVRSFLQDNLKLELHPKKIIFRKLDWGIDYLGYIILSHYRLPRTKTKRRVFQKLESKIGSKNFSQSLQSYLGYLGHANSYKVTQDLRNRIWLLDSDRRQN